jgi:hypothetical protein
MSAGDDDGEERACRFIVKTGGPGRAGPVSQGPVRQSRGIVQEGQVGQSQGPPARRPYKATEIAELLLDGEAAALTRKAVERALEGDGMALRLCLDRIIPARRGRAVQLAVPPMRGTADLASTMAAITTAATQGVITPGEAADLARVVEIHVRAVEVTDFDRRLRQLEEHDGVVG